MKPKIVIVGSANMDLVVSVGRHPQIGETILGGKFDTIPGGKGANQAVAAARMGAGVTMIGRVGKDGFGAELRANFLKDGIDIDYVRVDEQEPTGVALITVDKDGQNTIVVASGANHQLTPSDLIAARAAFVKADVMVTQLELPLDTVYQALALAEENGLRVVLNPAPAQALGADLLSKVDYLIPNEREAMQLAGTQSLDASIQKLLDVGVKNLIITLGEQGVLVATAGVRKHFPAYLVETVDTVAAGDAFVGTFAVGLAEGLPVDEAVRLGNAAAAISVTRHGAQPSLPNREEVNEFLINWK
ncbi:MAG: ribokinase [Chloroflexi bacterium]|nr:ribokinase [Chloroflexota bacterium]